ncbi:MAG: hypothetical protein H8E32_04540 [Nitrospinae bacterium]|nr:hypothetical protein [Nitrospinota bacterium]
MNPKEKIQQLIQTETEKWEDHEIRNENFRVRQVDNFQPLSVLLNELVASIEPEYIKINILDDHATIEVGNEIDRSSCIRWTIQPNFKKSESKEEYWNIIRWQKKVNAEAESGFKVQEKRGDDDEKNSEFGTENETIDYLAQEIAKRIAYYRYRKNV